VTRWRHRAIEQAMRDAGLSAQEAITGANAAMMHFAKWRSQIEQVLLSFGIALALVPLLIFTSNATLMGELVNTRRVKQIGWIIV
ncbi:hypothetical protein MJL48_33100, partial [Salmonella enterica subsp. enterica serovar Kentucky]|nr:hypothetical protein [Salmonella enterica subsp. enterica serovar Kentucky]